MDALNEIIKESPDANKAIMHIIDAETDALKAKEDAIDALVSFISMKISLIMENNKPSRIQERIPDIYDDLRRVRDVEKKISNTRS